jgi:quercetin dioxygenase-like cupin family protein
MTDTLSNPRILSPLDLLDFRQSAITSRVLLKGPSGNVTLFAFDGGEELSEHTCPYDALIHVLEGAAEVTIGGERNLLVDSQMVVLPAGVPHAVRAAKPLKMLLTILKG